MKASFCNGFYGIGLLDYAYLAFNVYHGKDSEKQLGQLPRTVDSLPRLISNIQSHEGWFQLRFPEVRMLHDFGFYAEFYVKVYRGKIRHLMVSFRGTDNFYDGGEDVLTWWNTVLPGSEYYSQKIPHYWHYALTFILKCKKVIKQLDSHDLLADYVGHHVTGHSLGGALANLVSATAAICQPVGIRAHLPVMPNVISFNAPGIGAMQGIHKDPFNEGMVISMRAKYDLVSALGEPYGYVINNIVPEGYQDAENAFDIEHQIDTFSFRQVLCDVNVACIGEQRIDQALNAKAFLKQHGMAHFLKLIANQPSALAFTFEQLRSWGMNHGGQNHNLNATPMFGQVAMAKVA